MAAPVLHVDPSLNNSTEIAISDITCWLPPNHVNSIFQTTLLALGLPIQIFGACLTYHVSHTCLILVTKLLSPFLIGRVEVNEALNIISDMVPSGI